MKLVLKIWFIWLVHICSVTGALAQMPELKPVFIDSANFKPAAKPIEKPAALLNRDTVKQRPLPAKIDTSAELVILLENPGHPRIAYGAGSPIQYYPRGEGMLVAGIVNRVTSNGLIITTDLGNKVIVRFDEIRKLRIPREGNMPRMYKLVGSAMIVGGLGYTLLYLLNPNGNTMSGGLSENATASLSTSVGIAAAGGLMQLLARDRRIRPGRNWKWRLDNMSPYYYPQLQR